MSVPRAQIGFQRTPLLAGWLFADLFLVLFVLSLASLPPKNPVPHVMRTPPPPPSRVLDRPVSFLITVPPTEFQDPATEPAAASRLVRLLNHALTARKMVGRQAGVLLVFASGPESAIDQAISTAKSVIGLVRRNVPGFSQVSSAGYWNGAGDYFKFEIFFFSRSASVAS
jgi:hypothetical protein